MGETKNGVFNLSMRVSYHKGVNIGQEHHFLSISTLTFMVILRFYQYLSLYVTTCRISRRAQSDSYVTQFFKFIQYSLVAFGYLPMHHDNLQVLSLLWSSTLLGIYAHIWPVCPCFLWKLKNSYYIFEKTREKWNMATTPRRVSRLQRWLLLLIYW